MSSGNGAQDSTNTTDQGAPRAASANEGNPVCFVIMPISDHPDYEPGHFKRVFEDIFEPACIKAGFRAVRADQVGQTNLIHLELARIGSLLFIFADSPNDQIGSSSTFWHIRYPPIRAAS